MIEPTPSRLFEVHARCAATLFDGHQIHGPLHRRVFGVAEEDPEWCFAVLTGGPLEEALAEALATVPGHAPWSVLASGFPGEPAGLSALLEDRGWIRIFQQCWLTAPAREGALPAVAGVALREVANREDLEGLVATFEAIHGGGLSWESALRKGLFSAGRRREGAQVHHLVAVANGEVVGIGSVVGVDGIAGLYNLAVRRDWRRRGVGRALTVARQQLAADLRCDRVLLLTDRRRVAAWHERNGFREEFRLDGWCRPDRCGPSSRSGGGTDDR